MPARRYDVPSGRVGRRLVQALSVKTTRIRKRRWNAKRFIVFQTVTLKLDQHITKSFEIRQRIVLENARLGSGGTQGAGGGYSANLRAVYIHKQGGGFLGSQVKDIPQPGAPGKTVIGSSMNHVEG